MEHILISPGKIKLMLTQNDLQKYELDCDTIDSEDPATKQSLRELLADVKSSSGFDVSDDKLFIQLYPSKDGGAEIYITKLSLRRQTDKSSESSVHITNVFKFENMRELLLACTRIPPHEKFTKRTSSAWMGDSSYFLITEENIPYREYLSGTQKSFDAIISENGIHIGSAAGAAYVREHCSCFCKDDAITTLAGLA